MKTKNKKLQKKDKFKDLKKKKYPISIAPAFIKRVYGISEICSTGVFKGDGYTKLYKVKYGENISSKEAFRLIRDYNISFRIYYIEDDIYMMIKVKADDLEDAVALIDKIEQDMLPKVTSLGITLTSVISNDRFLIAHRMIKCGMENKNINVENYFEDIVEYKEDFEMAAFHAEENAELVGETEHYKMFYLTKLPNQINEFLDELGEIDCMREIIFDFESVSDQAVSQFVKMNYMGIDGEVQKLKKSKPEVYKIYTGDITDKDTGYYTSCGFSVLLAKDKTESFEEELVKIESIMKKYSLKYFFYFEPEKALQEFIPFREMVVHQNRIYSSKAAENYFMSGYCEDEEDSENLDDMFLMDNDDSEDLEMYIYKEQSRKSLFDDDKDDEMDFEEIIISNSEFENVDDMEDEEDGELNIENFIL